MGFQTEGARERGSEGATVAKPRRERDSAVISKKRRWERRGMRPERPQKEDWGVSRGCLLYEPAGEGEAGDAGQSCRGLCGAASWPPAPGVGTSWYLCPGFLCGHLSHSWSSPLFSLDGVSVPNILGPSPTI